MRATIRFLLIVASTTKCFNSTMISAPTTRKDFRSRRGPYNDAFIEAATSEVKSHEKAMETCKVLLAENNPRLRQLIAEILASQPGVSLVGEVTDGQEAVRVALATRPDIVLMAIRLPQVSGLDAAQRIVTALSDTKVILLSLFDLPEYRTAALAHGAYDCLTKSALHTNLLPTISRLMTGQAQVM